MTKHIRNVLRNGHYLLKLGIRNVTVEDIYCQSIMWITRPTQSLFESLAGQYRTSTSTFHRELSGCLSCSNNEAQYISFSVGEFNFRYSPFNCVKKEGGRKSIRTFKFLLSRRIRKKESSTSTA